MTIQDTNYLIHCASCCNLKNFIRNDHRSIVTVVNTFHNISNDDENIHNKKTHDVYIHTIYIYNILGTYIPGSRALTHLRLVEKENFYTRIDILIVLHCNTVYKCIQSRNEFFFL